MDFVFVIICICIQTVLCAPSDQATPARLDYRKWNGVNVISPVYDQGPIESCWTFATMGALESQALMAGFDYVKLSEQQLISCVPTYRRSDSPVSGWDQQNAIRYLRARGAIADSDYPYRSNKTLKTERCKDSDFNYVDGLQVTDLCTQKLPVTEDKLKTVLFRNGPQAVTVVANDPWESKNSKKVISCSKHESYNPDYNNGYGTVGNHAILLVGYGTKDGVDVWIIKNSYGTSWGYDGFGYLTREIGHDCGITQHIVASPIIEGSVLVGPTCVTPPPRNYCEKWNYSPNTPVGETDSTYEEEHSYCPSQ